MIMHKILGDLVVDVGEPRRSDKAGACAGMVRLPGQRQEFTDRLDLEAELPGMPDEAPATKVRGIIETTVALSPRW